MQREWMKMVLKWQKPTGCFSLDNQALLSMEKQLSEYQNQERKLMTDLKWEVAMIEKQHQQHHGRKLLREQVMNDGCLSHKSGLGFGTLCLFNRFLVRQTYLNQGKL
ncbi:uncharacterized protein [Littorina saxatilis]|uniref:Uncharacterized protein n=2 Tax=Littorina saxatilis TaxID=31220 RepID=A0AAN9FYR6_9CAEN